MNIYNTAKFTFDYTWRDDKGEVTSRMRHVTSEETLGEVLDAFELILKGSGVVFNGKLDFFDEETQELIRTQMRQTGEPKPNDNKQLEFDFVKELFDEESKDIDKLDDLDK